MSGNVRATFFRPIPSGRKKRQIRRRLAHRPAHSVVLAQDETDLLLFPPLRACWSRRGEAKKVVLSGRNEKRVIFGALNLCTGRRVFLVAERNRQGDFCSFLRLIRTHYRGRHVMLLLDSNPSHEARASELLAEQLGIELVWLPKRSPELNPMDTLWGQAKDRISANRQRATIDQQVDLFLTFLRGLSNQQALRTAGVLSKSFWLKDVL